MEQENQDVLYQNLLNKYKRQLEYGKKYYEKNKTDEEFIAKNRNRSKMYYENNIEKKRDYYKSNNELIKIKNNYQYYKKNHKVDVFKERHSEKYNKLIEIGYITEDQ